MIISITSNTFESNDSGEILTSNPLDFILNVNHQVISFFSLTSRTVLSQHANDPHSHVSGFCRTLWSIIEDGTDESHGFDTAYSRTFTIILLTGCAPNLNVGSCEKRENLNFEIAVNHYGGRGASQILNRIIDIILDTFDELDQADVKFLEILRHRKRR